MSAAYDAPQVVGMDLHRRRSVLISARHPSCLLSLSGPRTVMSSLRQALTDAVTAGELPPSAHPDVLVSLLIGSFYARYNGTSDLPGDWPQRTLQAVWARPAPFTSPSHPAAAATLTPAPGDRVLPPGGRVVTAPAISPGRPADDRTGPHDDRPSCAPTQTRNPPARRNRPAFPVRRPTATADNRSSRRTGRGPYAAATPSDAAAAAPNTRSCAPADAGCCGSESPAVGAPHQHGPLVRAEAGCI